MGWSYWKVVMRYGHIGKGNEVSVARYLVTPPNATTIDVMDLIEEMPGTKSRAMLSIMKIEMEEYLEGVRLKRENFFLQHYLHSEKRSEWHRSGARVAVFKEYRKRTKVYGTGIDHEFALVGI